MRASSRTVALAAAWAVAVALGGAGQPAVRAAAATASGEWQVRYHLERLQDGWQAGTVGLQGALTLELPLHDALRGRLRLAGTADLATGAGSGGVEGARLTLGYGPWSLQAAFNEDHVSFGGPFALVHRAVRAPHQPSVVAAVGGEVWRARAVYAARIRAKPAGDLLAGEVRGVDPGGNEVGAAWLRWVPGPGEDESPVSVGAVDARFGRRDLRVTVGAGFLQERGDEGSALLATSLYAAAAGRAGLWTWQAATQDTHPAFRSPAGRPGAVRAGRAGYEVELTRALGSHLTAVYQREAWHAGTVPERVTWSLRHQRRGGWRLVLEQRVSGAAVERTQLETRSPGGRHGLTVTLDQDGPELARVRGTLEISLGQGRLRLGGDSRDQAWRAEWIGRAGRALELRVVGKVRSRPPEEAEWAWHLSAGWPTAATTRWNLRLGTWDRGRMEAGWGRPLDLELALSVRF